jgi:hypothetical protein
MTNFAKSHFGTVAEILLIVQNYDTRTFIGFKECPHFSVVLFLEHLQKAFVPGLVMDDSEDRDSPAEKSDDSHQPVRM